MADLGTGTLLRNAEDEHTSKNKILAIKHTLRLLTGRLYPESSMMLTLTQNELTGINILHLRGWIMMKQKHKHGPCLWFWRPVLASRLFWLSAMMESEKDTKIECQRTAIGCE